jgi:glycosyltransferase involved in cell wall biosynthesis
VKISFLVHNVYGVGGTNRTVVNLAGALAARHRVEIVSVFRWMDEPILEIPERVSLVPLLDMRRGQPDRDHQLLRERPDLIPPEEELYRRYSRLTDERIARHLRRSDADLVVGTRSGLNLCVARLGRPGALRLAQEHMTHEMIPPAVRAAMRTHYPRLDAAITLTEADAAAFRATTPVPGLRVVTIPNSVPASPLPPAEGTNPVVVAAGRADPVKRYDLLVRAFATVAADHPEWTLRIYGAGPELAALRRLVAGLGLHNHVFLMGRHTPLEPEWVKGSVAVVSSDQESFGMTLVEAMRCGLPVVSTACPVGPAEIIQPGVDGLLVPVGEVGAIAAGLAELIRDPGRRREMGQAALRNSQRFDPARIAEQYEELFSQLRRPRRRRLKTDGAGRLWQAASAVRRGRSRPPAGNPVGRYTVDKTASVLVSLSGGDAEGTPVALVCRERHNRHEPVEVPFDPDGNGRWRATLPASPDLLAEGRWDLFTLDSSGERVRVRAGDGDLRGLLSPAARPSTPVVRHVPYRTADGFLAIQSWVRTRHAEAGQIQFAGRSVTVEGRMLGEAFGARAPVLTLARRQDPTRLSVAGESSGGPDFRFTLPLHRLTEQRLTRHDDWDLWVTAPADPQPVRLARLLDDVRERKPIFQYPSVRMIDAPPPELVEETPAPRIWIRLYYTVRNELSLFVADS